MWSGGGGMMTSLRVARTRAVLLALEQERERQHEKWGV
jgi:hypothetical protein